MTSKLRRNHVLRASALAAFLLAAAPFGVSATDYSSASFIVRDPVVGDGGGYSSSASFQNLSSFGQTDYAIESSGSFIDCNGFLYFEGATAPTLTASPGSAQVTLNWTAARGTCGNVVTSYELGVGTASNGPYVFQNVGTALTFAKTGLTDGTPYFFVIRPLSGTTVLATSNEATATPATGGGGGGGGGGGPQPYTLMVTRPNGGESIAAGTTTTITWLSNVSATYETRISLSTDGGATFPVTVADIPQNFSSYDWAVPSMATTTNAVIKVEMLYFGSVVASDTSDAVFTVNGTATPPPPPPPPPPSACTVDCGRVSYDLYIINPDGTERHTFTNWVRSAALSGGVVRHEFEDKGDDFDYNDVVIDVTKDDCRAVDVHVVSLDAGWHHQIWITIFYDGARKRNVLLWPDSHEAVGADRVVDASTADICAEAGSGTPPGYVTLRSGDLIKGDQDTVYYYGIDGVRHPFPNANVYETWYNDFSKIKAVPLPQLRTIPLGPNVRYRPGSRLIKIVSDPKVYAVAAKSVLRWVTTGDIASALYGINWRKAVDDLNDAFFTDYAIGEPIVTAEAYSPIRTLARSHSIDEEQGLQATAPPQLPPTEDIVAPVCSTPQAFTYSLGVGSSDTLVKPLQELLQCLKFFPATVAPNGYFGPATEAAVKAYQQANGLDVTGSLSAQTRTDLNRFVLLASATSPAQPACTKEVTFTSTLALGSVDPQVLPLQDLLQCLGFFPATVAPNGYFGGATESAVRAFQQANGLDVVGVVGPATRAKLNTY